MGIGVVTSRKLWVEVRQVEIDMEGLMESGTGSSPGCRTGVCRQRLAVGSFTGAEASESGCCLGGFQSDQYGTLEISGGAVLVM